MCCKPAGSGLTQFPGVVVIVVVTLTLFSRLLSVAAADMPLIMQSIISVCRSEWPSHELFLSVLRSMHVACRAARD